MIAIRRTAWIHTLMAATVMGVVAGCAALPQPYEVPHAGGPLPKYEAGGPTSATIRGQNTAYDAGGANSSTPGSNGAYQRYPMTAAVPNYPQTHHLFAPPPPAAYSGQYGQAGAGPVGRYALPPPSGTVFTPQAGGLPSLLPPPGANGPVIVDPPPLFRTTPVDVFVNETETGRFMVGVGVNSEAGITGNIVIDERNFDWRRIPTSFDDFINGVAWRGGGQGFRIEALPGDRVQRYLVNFTEPYLFDTQVSLNLSGFFYNRRFFDWDEQRFGGRIGLGYRLTPDLSLTGALRAEDINIHDPRVAGVPELDAAVGKHDLFSGRITLTHDTRDVPFSPTEGYLVELSYEQVFGSFDYPRGNLDFRRYFLVTERPDGSGRHVLGYSFRLGISGSQTPIFENFFAGGFSTMRGFDFRGASPKDATGRVIVGGEFRFLGSVEYTLPITADDMLKAVVFCDFGTVEESIEINANNYRIAPGVGLRIFVPAMGPAPIALDLAFPVASALGDDIQIFSFFIGFGR